MRMQRLFLSLFLCSHQICCNSFRLRAHAASRKHRRAYGVNSTKLSTHTDGTSHIDISVLSRQIDSKVDMPLFRSSQNWTSDGTLTIHLANNTLGSGSFATVFEASVNGDRKHVAKIMEKAELANIFYNASESNPAQEASIMALLRGHGGFIQMEAYFSGEELEKLAPEDFSRVFDETISGGELLRGFECARKRGDLFIFIMEKGGKPWSNLARRHQDALFPRLQEIVASMHKLHIYHLDLHGENILVDEKRNIKLIDFGTAISAEHLGSFQKRALSAHAAQKKGQLSGFGEAAMRVLQACLNETADFMDEQLITVINPTVLVRDDKSLTSREVGRLSAGDLVKIEQKVGHRLRYVLQHGSETSPAQGWISAQVARRPTLCKFSTRAEKLATLIDEKCLENLLPV